MVPVQLLELSFTVSTFVTEAQSQRGVMDKALDAAQDVKVHPSNRHSSLSVGKSVQFIFMAGTHPESLRQETSGRLRGPQALFIRLCKRYNSTNDRTKNRADKDSTFT